MTLSNEEHRQVPALRMLYPFEIDELIELVTDMCLTNKDTSDEQTSYSLLSALRELQYLRAELGCYGLSELHGYREALRFRSFDELPELPCLIDAKSKNGSIYYSCYIGDEPQKMYIVRNYVGWRYRVGDLSE